MHFIPENRRFGDEWLTVLYDTKDGIWQPCASTCLSEQCLAEFRRDPVEQTDDQCRALVAMAAGAEVCL